MPEARGEARRAQVLGVRRPVVFLQLRDQVRRVPRAYYRYAAAALYVVLKYAAHIASSRAALKAP